MLGARWEYLDVDGCILHLPPEITKTDTGRDVPLSSAAVSILRSLPRRSPHGLIFPIQVEALKSAWYAAVARGQKLYLEDCLRCGVDPEKKMLVDLHLHDTRHEAASRAFEKGLNLMEASVLTGHRDLRSLKRYTQLKAKDIAKKLG